MALGDSSPASSGEIDISEYFTESSTLLGDLRDMFLDREKRAAILPWDQRSERDQADSITRAKNDAREVLQRLIALVAAHGLPSFTASLPKVYFTDKGIELKAVVVATDDAVIGFARAQGKTVQISLIEAAAFEGQHRPEPEAQKDQRELPIASQPEAPAAAPPPTPLPLPSSKPPAADPEGENHRRYIGVKASAEKIEYKGKKADATIFVAKVPAPNQPDGGDHFIARVDYGFDLGNMLRTSGPFHPQHYEKAMATRAGAIVEAARELLDALDKIIAEKPRQGAGVVNKPQRAEAEKMREWALALIDEHKEPPAEDPAQGDEGGDKAAEPPADPAEDDGPSPV